MGQLCIETATGRVREWVRNGQPSTYDPATHTLMEQDEPPPNDMKWSGSGWVPDLRPPPQSDLDRADARAKIDDVLSDVIPAPAKIKAAFAALRKVLG